MSRSPRVHVCGGFYHVTLRGNHRRPIFFAERDRMRLSSLVAEFADRFGARVHCYCWMTNHVHLVIEVGQIPLSRIMLHVASRYARIAQARLSTTGHLFERRYHALLIDVDRYLLAVIRYVHRNPLAAGLVREISEYRWSSHANYVGDRREPWITTEFVLRMFHTQPPHAIAAYRRFVAGADEGSQKYPIPGITSGDAGFVREIKRPVRILQASRARVITLDQLITEACVTFGTTPGELASPSRTRRLARARATVAKAAVESRIASIAAVARRFGRDESSLRESVGRLDQPTSTAAGDALTKPPDSQ